MSRQNFQIDGVGINAEHYSTFTEADFIKDIIPAIPAHLGLDDKKKEVWAKNAYVTILKHVGVDQAPAVDKADAPVKGKK